MFASLDTLLDVLDFHVRGNYLGVCPFGKLFSEMKSSFILCIQEYFKTRIKVNRVVAHSLIKKGVVTVMHK